MASKLIYWFSDGVGADIGDVPTLMKRWMVAQPSVELIIYGGDVYNKGTDEEFAIFKKQMDDDLSLMCETPGNHDYAKPEKDPVKGRIPPGYEKFWSDHAPPLSRQPVDATKKGGARYEHVIEINGWRLIFMDTGRCESVPWPMGDETRAQWLSEMLSSEGGRAKILFAHHSRLSRGDHGDMDTGVGRMWEMLFDEQDKPRIALTVAGHDHNVSVYGPRPKKKPGGKAVAFADGIYLIVNGAGGAGHYEPDKGTKPDLAQDLKNYCVTQIELVDEHTAKVVTLSFGSSVKSTTVPKEVPHSAFTLSV